MAFHFFPAAAPGVGAGTSPAGTFLYCAFAMGVVEAGLRKRSSGGRDSGSFGVIRRRGKRWSETLVNIIQETIQAGDPCLGSRIAPALIRWEGEKHPSSTQGLPQPPASLRGLTWSTGGS